MAARPRILCIGDHLETTAEELRAVGFDVMLAPNAQAARICIPPLRFWEIRKSVKYIRSIPKFPLC
jgi:hypothetical protein